jgi:hypothetical protein
MLLGATFTQAREWRVQAAVPATVLINELAELEQCTPIHLKRWLNEQLPPRLPPAHKRILEQLKDKLPQEFEKPFYLSPLKSRVRELVKEAVHG